MPARAKVRTAPVRRNPHVLAAVAEMTARGLHRSDVCARLRISERSFYYCLEEIERARAQALNGSGE